MSKITWKNSKVDGRIGVSVPYRQLFNDELKAIVHSAKFEKIGYDGIWYFDEEAVHLVRPLLDKYYLNVKWHRAEWSFKAADGLQIDGCNLLFVARDYWKWRRGSGFDMEIVECELSTGGSRNNPCISGKLVLEIALREGAVTEPTPASIEEIDTPPPLANPLETIPNETMLKELAARGLVLFDTETVQAAILAAAEKAEINYLEMDEATRALFRKYFRHLRRELEGKEDE